MGLSLRIDVDNPFGYATFFKKVLNRFSLDYNIVPRWSLLGYLDHTKKLRSYLDQNSVPATWFFRTITAPKKQLSLFQKKPFDLALHAERTDSLDTFSREVEKWTNEFGKSPNGFSKHGSGDIKLSRMHAMEYDAESFIDFGKKLGFEFFSGNGTNYESNFENRAGFVYIPSVFWLDNLDLYPEHPSLDDIISLSETKDIVVLVHPFWWSTRTDVRDGLDYLINSVKFIPLVDQVETFRKSAVNT